MTKSYLIDDTMRLLGKSLNVTTRRHSLIAGNIANIDTVGYTPKDLDFQKTLEAEMARQPEKLTRTDMRHYAFGAESSLNQTLVEAEDPFHPDPVNIDTEMSHLVENNIQYRTSVEMLKRKMSILKHAISEGGR
ncbi:MAG: flagellar basal body rod protein FlgB [Proteobacteria bacterium]|nr:flagellar basal body rod protein FlgB [Pseudomonadota bacterium]